ncbi:dTDP-4-dehydrorhamnose 3,5-epimerase family protein [Pararhodonellum marinum]|uniref:dTDP-4-dehydrorhamnose 3,5-epimerase family protein n=1 Tax=Pararhodonellum marinum TaxID=2755358 RepID=UPI001890A974|nr:dTDP-4-dehydrorhamnose 3,5-epimerase family protein [Pararhodonellum marinum]
MEVENTPILDLKIIHLTSFHDLRGVSVKYFSHDFFLENDLETNFKELTYSLSKKNVIRGMHFQMPPHEQIKLISLSHGEIVDVILDYRLHSPSYGKFFSIHLTDALPKVVYVPKGCAHGFLSLKNNTIVNIQLSETYMPDAQGGILYNSFGMDWKVINPNISKKDLTYRSLYKLNEPLLDN